MGTNKTPRCLFTSWQLGLSRVKGPGRCLQKIWRHPGFSCHWTLLRAPFLDHIKHGACLASLASAATCPQLPWPLQVRVLGEAETDLGEEEGPGGWGVRSHPALKKDGRIVASSTALCPHCPAAGDWPTDQEEAAPPGRGLAGRWKTRLGHLARTCGNSLHLWNSGLCPRRSLSMPPDGGIRNRVPSPCERRTYPWPNPGDSRGRNQVHVYRWDRGCGERPAPCTRGTALSFWPGV